MLLPVQKNNNMYARLYSPAAPVSFFSSPSWSALQMWDSISQEALISITPIAHTSLLRKISHRWGGVWASVLDMGSNELWVDGAEVLLCCPSNHHLPLTPHWLSCARGSTLCGVTAAAGTQLHLQLFSRFPLSVQQAFPTYLVGWFKCLHAIARHMSVCVQVCMIYIFYE